MSSGQPSARLFPIWRYRHESFLGRGGFGDVYSYKKKEEEEGEKDLPERVAVKKLQEKMMPRREEGLLNDLEMEHIVTYLGRGERTGDPEDRVWLVMELCHSDLGRFGSVSTECEAAFLSRQMARAVDYMHGRNILHRDLKPQNVLINFKDPGLGVKGDVFDFKVKVADFDFARRVASTDPGTLTMCGTMAFMAPEVISNKGRFDKSADVYSFGATLLALLAGGGNLNPQMIARGLANNWDDYDFSGDLKDILNMCLSLEMTRRPTSRHLLSLPFFFRFDDPYSLDERYQEDSLKICRTLHGDGASHPDVASTIGNRGMSLYLQERYLEALQDCQRALDMRKSLKDVPMTDVVSSLINVGLCLGALGRHQQALDHFQQVLDLTKDAELLNVDIGSVYKHMGDCHKALKNPKEAAICYRKSRQQTVNRLLRAQNRCFDPIRVQTAARYFNLLDCHAETAVTLVSGSLENKRVFRVKRVLAEYITSDKPVKKVLGLLTYYHDHMPNIAKENPKGSDEMVKQPLFMNIFIGGEAYQFIMQEAGKGERQIFVGFTRERDIQVPHTYNDIARLLDHHGMSETCARVILEVIQAKGSSLNDWGGMSSDQKEAAKELIVLTHVAEGAIPDKKEVDGVLKELEHFRKPNNVRGGIGGIAKTARLTLRRIAKGMMTFQEAFNSKDGRFIMARSYGKRYVKTGLYRFNKGTQVWLQDIIEKDADGISVSSTSSEPSTLSAEEEEDMVVPFRRKLRFFKQGLSIERELYGEGASNIHVATTHRNIGGCLLSMGRYSEASDHFYKSLAMFQKVFGGEEEVLLEIATTLDIIGCCLIFLEQHEEAMDSLVRSLKMRKSAKGDGAQHPDIALSLDHLGLCLQAKGETQAALDSHLEGLNMLRDYHGECSSHPDVASSLNNLAACYCSLEKYEESLEYCQQGLEVRKAHYGDGAINLDIASSLKSLAKHHMATGQSQMALELYQENLAAMRSMFGQTARHPDIAKSLCNIAVCQHAMGQDAQASYQHAVDMVMPAEDKSSPTLADMAPALKHVSDQHRTIYSSEASSFLPSLITALQDTAALFRSQDRNADALSIFERVSDVSGEKAASNEIALALRGMADCHEALRNYEEAARCYHECMRMRKDLESVSR